MLFRDKIVDLTTACPRDLRVKDEHGNDKGAFWTEKRRFPTPQPYDAATPDHREFMISATNLFAEGGLKDTIRAMERLAADGPSCPTD